MRNMFTVLGCVAGMLVLGVSCEEIFPKAPNENSILDGPIDGLTFEQNKSHLNGDNAFNGQIFTALTGLGPIFVANSCGSCHPGDGKGHPFTTLTRFGQVDSTGNKFLDFGGPQLQNRSIPGVSPESIPDAATFAKFTPPAVTGLGFLEAVPDASLLAMADVNDTNGDGISGVPNYIEPPSFFTPHESHRPRGGKYIGRFGKKAGALNLLHQTANAYIQDMGITSDFHMQDLISEAGTTDQVADPEVTAAIVHQVAVYLQTLKAPIQRNQNDPTVMNGKNIFVTIGCENCHKQTLTTGSSSIKALANKDFHPYTDLLLHNMGDALDDGYTEGTALPSEWRTPPLWGLGLSRNSQGGSYFLMHDGCAHSIQEAIMLHGGEGTISRTQFQNLTDTEKMELIKFLESL